MKQMTTGATNDFEQATEIAHKMVARWGMSADMGPRVYGDNESEVFLGRDVMTHRNVSETTAQKLDMEITRIIDEQYNRARKILDENREKVEIMAKSLMEWETLDSDQLNDIMDGREPKPPEDISGIPSAPTGKKRSQNRPKVKPRLDEPAGDQP